MHLREFERGNLQVPSGLAMVNECGHLSQGGPGLSMMLWKLIHSRCLFSCSHTSIRDRNLHSRAAVAEWG